MGNWEAGSLALCGIEKIMARGNSMNRLKRSTLACVLITAFAVLLLTRQGARATTPSCGAWSVVSSPNAGSSSNFLQAISAVSASDVWAVGGYFAMPGSTVPSQTLIEHWNGTAWSIVSSPNVGTNQNFLEGVSAASSNDIWAVGYEYAASVPSRTLTEHWNGSAWSIVSSPNATGANQLRAVVAISATNAWAVGFSNNNGTVHTLTEHWNGSKWSIVSSPNVGTLGSVLYSVTKVSATNIWAVGEYSASLSTGVYAQTLTEHWNGSKWSVVSSPNAGPSGSANGGFFGVTAVAASNIWAVGYYVVNGTTPVQTTLIEHWNGSKWSIVSSPNVASDVNRLFGVAFISASNVWTVGYSTPISGGSDQTLTEHWNGTSWSIVSSPNVGSSNNDLNGVTTIPANNQVWTAGIYDTNPTPQTLTEFYC
jgi:hypothetical protein